MIQSTCEKFEELGKVILQLIFVLLALVPLYITIRIAYILLSLSRYASLHFWSTLIAALALLGFILKKLKGLKRLMRAKNLSRLDAVLRGLFLAPLIFWLVLSLSLVVYIEAEYVMIRNSYRRLFLSHLKSYGKERLLDAAWNITLALKQEFKGTYGLNVFIPSRIPPFLSPILSLYRWTGGMGKLIVVQRMGGCGEFATAVVTLLKDVARLQTRKILFEGVDHSLPEVYFKGEWYVFDVSYTTSDYPVRAKHYALYLRYKLGLDEYVSRIVVESTGLNVLREHGFNSSTLVIKAIIDITTNPLDDTPAVHAVVEVFALKNMYDPLVASGHTDERGNFSVQLNGGKEYIVIVRHSYGHSSVIGVTKVYLPPNSCVVKEVRLHKYD